MASNPNVLNNWERGRWGFLTFGSWELHLNVTGVLVALTVTLSTYWIICRWRHFSLWRRHGIPGPAPSIVFGNLLQIRTKNKDILAVQTEWLERYGNVCGYFTGYRPSLLVADLEMIKQILIKDFPSFANRARHFLAKKPYSDMIVDQRDQRWKFLRRITNPVFSLAKLKMMSGLMQESVDDFLAVVSEHAESGEDFDVFSVSQRLTLDIIGRCALAMKLDCLLNPEEPLLLLVRRFFQFAISPIVVVAMVFPGLASWLRFFRASTDAALVEKAITANLREVLARRRANPLQHSVDFLQLFIEASDDPGTIANSPLEMTEQGTPEELNQLQRLIRPTTTSKKSSLSTPAQSKAQLELPENVSAKAETILPSQFKVKMARVDQSPLQNISNAAVFQPEMNKEYPSTENPHTKPLKIQSKYCSSCNKDQCKNCNSKFSGTKSNQSTKTNDSSKDVSEVVLEKLTDDEIVGNAYMFVLAGYETTANAIAFTCYTLAKHQEWQEKCYSEIQTVLGYKAHLTYEDVGRLTVLDRVLQESLRLYPPVPSFVTREAGVTCEVGGITIPKGVNVTVPVWHIHHHPELWPEPYKFDPDRFLPERKKDHHPLSYLPFGAGPRNCLGLRFARLEIKMVLGQLLRDYSIQLAPSVKEPLPVAVRTVTLSPTEGVKLRVKKRNHSHLLIN